MDYATVIGSVGIVVLIGFFVWMIARERKNQEKEGIRPVLDPNQDDWRDGKSDEELRAAIGKEVEYAVSMVFLHADLVKRLHEVRFHGGEGDAKKLHSMALDAQNKFINFFVEAELDRLQEVIGSQRSVRPTKDAAS